MSLKCSWGATPAGTRNAARAAARRWGDAWHFHKRDMLLRCMAAAIFWFLSPSLLAWVSPALLGPAPGGTAVARERQRVARRRLSKVRAAAHARGGRSAGAGCPAHGADRHGAPASGRRTEVTSREIARHGWRISRAICPGRSIRRAIPIRTPSPRSRSSSMHARWRKRWNGLRRIERVEVAGSAVCSTSSLCCPMRSLPLC